MPRPKKTVTMRLDAGLLEWFRASRCYQTRINAILRAHMNALAHSSRNSRRSWRSLSS
ncbi:MAG TPA: BrnA antitoxin family protein [Terriglobia bacterium]|nr:BrnA antitoxin family protein [Terriglobia bacterium]